MTDDSETKEKEENLQGDLVFKSKHFPRLISLGPQKKRQRLRKKNKELEAKVTSIIKYGGLATTL